MSPGRTEPPSSLETADAREGSAQAADPYVPRKGSENGRAEHESAPSEPLEPGNVSALSVVNPASSGAEPSEDATAAAARARAIRRSIDAGNVRAGRSLRLKHGVYSEAIVRPEVRDEAALLLARMPWVDEVRDGPLVEGTARLLVRLRLMDEALDAEPSRDLLALASRLEGQLLRNLDALGATPKAAAALGLAKLSAADHARKLAERDMTRYAPKKRS